MFVVNQSFVIFLGDVMTPVMILAKKTIGMTRFLVGARELLFFTAINTSVKAAAAI